VTGQTQLASRDMEGSSICTESLKLGTSLGRPEVEFVLASGFAREVTK